MESSLGSRIIKNGNIFIGYDCAISQTAQTRIVTGWKQVKFYQKSTISIQEIAAEINPQMVGIIRYYGKYRKWALQKLIRRFQHRLAKWVLNKYKGFKGSYSEAYKWIKYLKRSYPGMFYYWTVFKHV